MAVDTTTTAVAAKKTTGGTRRPCRANSEPSFGATSTAAPSHTPRTAAEPSDTRRWADRGTPLWLADRDKIFQAATAIVRLVAITMSVIYQGMTGGMAGLLPES